MTFITAPTAQDRARDLATDLLWLQQIVLGACDERPKLLAFASRAIDMLPAAIRRALAAEAETARLQLILDKPVVALFSPERLPTENERHLFNLLSWRQQEAADAKAEVARLRAELESRPSPGPFADDAAAKGTPLGATGVLSEGTRPRDDQGGLRAAVGIQGDKVVIDFGKTLAWVSATAAEAQALANVLRSKAAQLEKQAKSRKGGAS